MTATTFILGVGCQKGGTTWLHSYLAAHPETNLGLLKEYHLFDVLEFGDQVPFRARFEKQFRTASEKLETINPDRFRALARLQKDREEAGMRLEFYEDPEKYITYFSDLANDAEVLMVGDITPNYALLPEDRLIEIRTKLEAAGFSVRPVFLIRDPVDRFYSAVRMRLRKTQGGSKSQSKLRKFYMSALESPFDLQRSQYEKTFERLDRCFGPENVFVGIFEEFFQNAEIERLTDFLGISFYPPNFERGARITSTKASAIDQELLEVCRARLEPTYQYCKERLGEEKIQSAWINA